MVDLSQKARAPTEGGLLNHRIDFARETDIGVPPENPDFNLYADVMNNAWNWTPDGSVEPQRGIGHIDPQAHFGGPVENEIEFNYPMQKEWLDSNGNPLDASFDFFFRDDCGTFHSTHTIVGREDHCDGGTTGAGFRTYRVALGSYPSEAEAEADASESMPLPMNLTYMAEKVTSYLINQPAKETTLSVKSTDTVDQTQSVTIESEGATKAETVQLSGTTEVTTTTKFGDVDAVWLSGYTLGDVVVTVSSSGDEIMTIGGKRTNSPPGSTQLQGDRGVPVLNSGSRQTQVEPENSRTWQWFIGDRIERVAGAQIGPRINSATLTVDNGVDTNERIKSRRLAIDRGPRTVEVEASIAGPKTTHQAIMDHLRTRGAAIEWEFESDQMLNFPEAVITEPGEYAPEEEQVAMYIDATFASEGVQLVDSSGTVVAE